MRLKYDGPLTALVDLYDSDFIITHPDDQFDPQPTDGTEQWFYYQISVPEELDSQYYGESCQFKFVYNGWQEDLVDDLFGFNDVEEIENLLVQREGNSVRPESEIASSEFMFAENEFPIDYEASDDEGFGHVELWYSLNFQDWQLFGSDVPNSPGSFSFMASADGFYRFITVAFDDWGNVEDKNGNGLDDNTELEVVAQFLGASIYEVQVDTTGPNTVISLGEFGDDLYLENRFAVNEKLVNGNFEDNNPERGWVWGGDGDHIVVDDADLWPVEVKSGTNSAMVGWLDSDPLGSGEDYLYQELIVPAFGNPTLSFWYRVISEDAVDFDWFSAKIIDSDGAIADEIVLGTGSDELGPDSWSYDSWWQEATHSLVSWLGETVKIWFGVSNNDIFGSPLRTYALIDDIRVTDSDNFLTSYKDMDLVSHDAGSGVETTYYRVNGGDWIEYVGTFVPGDLEIFDGESGLIEYYSVDFAGNESEIRSINITVDDDKDYFSLVLNKISPRISTSVVGVSGTPLDGIWVEIWNNGQTNIDIDGYVLQEAAGGYLPISSSNGDNNGNLLDGGETLVPAGGWLRIYRNGDSDFSLDPDGDTVKFLTDYPGSGGQLIDSYTYAETSAVNKLWQRIPDGIGTWADPEVLENDVLGGVVLAGFVPSPKLNFSELVWIKNTQEKPTDKDNPNDDVFKPVSLENWQICRTDSSLSKYNPASDDYDPQLTPDICFEIKPDMNPINEVSDREKMELGPEQMNLYISDFAFEDEKGAVFLIDGNNQCVDSYEYGSLEEGVVLLRDSTNQGLWKEPEMINTLGYYLYPEVNENWAEVRIEGLPKGGVDFQLEVKYISQKQEKGIFDEGKLTGEDFSLTKKYFLGSCSSSGAVCTPDPEISAVEYSLKVLSGDSELSVNGGFKK